MCVGPRHDHLEGISECEDSAASLQEAATSNPHKTTRLGKPILQMMEAKSVVLLLLLLLYKDDRNKPKSTVESPPFRARIMSAKIAAPVNEEREIDPRAIQGCYHHRITGAEALRRLRKCARGNVPVETIHVTSYDTALSRIATFSLSINITGSQVMWSFTSNSRERRRSR